MVAFGMDWPNAIRLAVELLRMAKATQQELPAEVEISSAGLTSITTIQDRDEGGYPNPRDVELVCTAQFSAFDTGGEPVIRAAVVNGLGNESSMLFTATKARAFAHSLLEWIDEAESKKPRLN